MNSKIPDDLLSAFLDREVTPEEDVLARKHLQTSSQARQEFQDYQRLGELLHELPRKTAPTEFASAVMQQAERETLIPLETAGAPAVDSPASRPSRRTWIVSIVGLAATAAAILVIVNLPRRNEARKDAVAIRDDVSIQRRSELSPAKEKFAAKSSPAVPALQPAAPASAALAKLDARSSSRRAGSPGRAAPSPALVADKPSAAEASKARMVFPADLKQAHEGDVIEALESVGDRVAVVRLTLVNRTDSFGSLQNLLVREASRPVNDAEKDKLKERFAVSKGSVVVDSKAASSNGPGELICVFVEGSRDELVGVLKDVQSQSYVQRAQLTNAISAAELAQYAQRPVSTANQARGEHSRAQTLSLPHASVDKITGEATTLWDRQEVAQAPLPQSANELTDLVQSTTGDASQKRKILAQQSIPTPAPAQQEQKAGQKAQDQKAAAIGGKQLMAGATQRSYQVFFVLDDQSVTEPQGKAAAAGEAQVAPESAHVRPRSPVRARRPGRKRVAKP